MARREIDASRTSPGCSAHGDTPLRRIRHALGRTAPRRGARRPPHMSRGARRPPLGDELEEMAELSRRRPPNSRAEQCAQEARGHLVPVAPNPRRVAEEPLRQPGLPCSLSSSAQWREQGTDEREQGLSLRPIHIEARGARERA
jgi:hypothetical protein